MGCYKPEGNTNNNAAKPPLKRQNSRLSAPALTTIDFVYNGNTEPINSLIKHCGKGGHAASTLTFETNLRTWDSRTAPKMTKPFSVI